MIASERFIAGPAGGIDLKDVEMRRWSRAALIVPAG